MFQNPDKFIDEWCQGRKHRVLIEQLHGIETSSIESSIFTIQRNKGILDCDKCKYVSSIMSENSNVSKNQIALVPAWLDHTKGCLHYTVGCSYYIIGLHHGRR